jgi:succinoglycan biosynthesis transport protein ExoP
MELSSFFKLLLKYIYILIAIPLVTVIATYFLVKNLPDSYVSHAQIATGIVDASKHLLDKDNTAAVQGDEVGREFSNLIEIIKLKRLIDNVSYQLIIHDLSSSESFRKFKKYKNLSSAAQEHALIVYKDKLQKGEPLNIYNPDENGLNELLIDLKYDERSLRKDLIIERNGESDFIIITFVSENPQLSAFVPNALTKEFIVYYTQNIKANESNAANFLTDLVAKKKAALDAKTSELQQYKIQNGILNLDEQSKSIFAQILAYTDKKMQAEQQISSYAGALKNIDDKFDPKDRKYIESTVSQFNQAITSTTEQIHAYNNQYVHSGFDPRYKRTLDSLQHELTNQINQSSDKYITNPLIGKDDLVRKKLELEVQRDLAKYSVASINKEINDLKAKYASLVPLDATVKTYNYEIDIASKEYLDALNKYNQTNLQSNFSIKLLQIETATPGIAEPSKKILLILLAGIISFIFCVLVLFVLFYLDDNIKEPGALVSSTNLPLLGSLNTVSGPKLDLRKLWDVEHRQKMHKFKELLRSIRFEVDQELRGEKILAVTSLGEGEGKTVLAMSLAYSYAAINKKVLLIDGNFDNPAISKSLQPQLFIEDYFVNNYSYIDKGENKISVLGNQGGDITLLEIADEKHIHNLLNELRSQFDVIIIDVSPLNSLNRSKEWLLFANKTIAVFEANQPITKQQVPYINYLKTLHNKFAGWVLNKVPEKSIKA